MLGGFDILSDCHLIETLTPRLQLPVASSKNTRPRVGLPTSVPKRPMSSSVPYQSPRPPQTPFAFLRRFGRSGGSRQPDLAPAVSAIAPKTPDPAVAQPPPRPRTSPPAALSEADQALCRNADAYAQRYNWVVAQTEEPLEAGLFLENGEVCAWAIDRDEPARAISLALVVDGSAVFEAWTDPDANEIAIATGYHLQGHRTFDLLVDGVATRGPAFAGTPFWPSPAARADLLEFLNRQRKTYREKARQRHLQRDIGDVLDRLTRIDAVRDDGSAPPSMPATVRYLSQRSRGHLQSGGPLAIANWIVSEIFEDPHWRTMFCLDPAVEAILNEPAFNTQALRSDVSLGLLCFWRRHYRDLDIFSDDGLRRIQFKFATAPFINHKNNHRLISAAITERLSALAGTVRAGDLPWSWYWTYLHQDQGHPEKLRDAQYGAALSFKEVTQDALDPERMSYNPPYWHSHWTAWAAGDGAGFSRFDLALLALLADSDAPERLLAQDGPAVWRQRLIDAFYHPMPGLGSLSLACDLGTSPGPAGDHRYCDVAVVGWTNGTGLARNMAMFAEALRPCRPLVFDAHSGRCINAEVPEDAEVRARVVILCVNADAAPEVIGRLSSLCAGAHIVGFFLWETDYPPAIHRFGVLAVDEIWTPSSYVADAYHQITDVPISVIGKGLRTPDPRTWMPFVRRFRRDSAPFVFLYMAEFGSSIIRKNPLDGVKAFQAAFDRDNRNVRFVLKMRNIEPNHWSNIDGYWEELADLIAGDTRIELVTGDLPEEEYWAMIGAADAIVSLHRAEGFGYPIADAMALGRPVVVSDYSGSRDFCDAETAFLVDVEVIPTPPSHLRHGGYIGNWCVPRMDSAVAAMRQVVARRDEAARRAAAGQARILEHYNFETWRSDLLERVAALLPGRNTDAPARLTLSSLAPAAGGGKRER